MSEVSGVEGLPLPSNARQRRLFVGIAIDDAVQAQCEAIALRLERSGVRAKLVVPQNYHLTLFFFGNVAEERVASIDAALRAAAARHRAFTITLDRIGAFPHERKPRIIFLGSRGIEAAYRALARDVQAACERLGFTSENDAIPHVTLARVPERTRTALPALDVTPLRVSVAAIMLFESLPHEGRTRYDVRSTFALSVPI